MSIRKLKLLSGETRYEVCVYSAGRGSKRIYRRFDRRAEADAFLHEYKAEKDELRRTRPDVGHFEETTFRTEAEYWFKYRSHTFSPGHIKRAKGVLDELLPQFGSLRPNRLTPNFVCTFQAEQAAKGLQRDTINRKVEVINAILNFSVKHRRIPYNPCVGFEKLRVVRDELPHWELEEAQSFLDFANTKYPRSSPERWKYVVYLLAINSGLRAGEIWGLKPQDILQNGEIILVQRQYDRLRKEYRPTKGKKNRRAPCNSELFSELTEIIRSQKVQPDDPIFQNESRRSIDHDNFKNRTFKSDINEWGGKKIRFHDLRHTAVTLMVAAGFDLKTVQEIAGHQDIKTTMGYTHRVAESIKNVARTFVIKPRSEKPGLRLIASND